MIRVLSLVVLAALLCAAVPASAQILPGTDPLTLVITPSYPRPYQSVSIVPRSTLVDLSASTVEISVNGISIYSGSGTEGATTRVGGLGEKTTVLLKVTDPSGQTYSKQVTLRPAEVSLVMEPVSTTHPFYLGGSLVAGGGDVRLIAIPDLRTAPGTRLSAGSLIYNWRIGDQLLTDYSGIGRSTLTASAPPRYRNAVVTVTVTTPDNTLVGEAKTTVTPVDPIARIYQNDPLLGPNFDVALGSRFSMPDTEATFRAVGYFFAVPPTLAWRVNSTTSGADKDITVRATGNGSGSAQIRLTASDPAHYQSADTAVSVGFGGSSGGLGIFGL